MKNLTAIRIAPLTIALQIFSLYSLFAQTTQEGRVVEYNGENAKTPIAGVEINIKNASSTVSDTDGRFILEFKTMRPGQHVNVNSIIKEGYEVFHLDAIAQWNINPDVPYTIVMVNSARFKERCDKYFNASSQSYRTQHEAELMALEAERQEGRLTLEQYEQERAELIASYELRLQNLTAYIDRFARIDLETLSVVEREIIADIEAGKIDTAIKMYEDQKFVQTYMKQIEQRDAQIAKMNTDIYETYQAIRRQILVYMIAGGEENFNKVIELYDLILAADPNNMVIASDYVEFLVQQGYYTKTIDIGNLVLQNNPNDDIYTTVCHDIACAYILTHDNDMARKYIMDGLARCHIDEPLYYTLQHDLAEIYWKLGEVDKARATAQIILDSEYADSIAISGAANTLGNIEYDCGRYEEAIKAYSLLFDNARSIAQGGHDMLDKIESLHSMVTAYLNVALCHSKLGNFNDSIENYKQANSLSDDLYNYNPEKYANMKYTLHNNMGMLYNLLGDNTMALKEITTASHYVDILYKQSPEAHGATYYYINNNLGYLSYMEGKYLESELYYDRAFEFIHNIYLASPSADIKIEYARININYASLYNDMGKIDKAIEKSTIAIEIIDELYAIYGEGVRFEHALAYRAHIIAYHNKGAKKMVKSTLERFKGFYGESYEYNNIEGEIALISGNEKRAREYYNMVIAENPTYYVNVPSPLNDKFMM